MAQNSFDQLSKQYLEEFLAPIGQVIRNLEIPGEAKFVDVFFNPNPDAIIDPDLGLLGRIIQTTCSLEPFRNPPSRNDIRTCLTSPRSSRPPDSMLPRRSPWFVGEPDPTNRNWWEPSARSWTRSQRRSLRPRRSQSLVGWWRCGRFWRRADRYCDSGLISNKVCDRGLRLGD